MKYIPLLFLFLIPPAKSITWEEFWRPISPGTYYRSPVYHESPRLCNKVVYKEQYIPGNSWKPGYVRYWKETIRVPCYR